MSYVCRFIFIFSIILLFFFLILILFAVSFFYYLRLQLKSIQVQDREMVAAAVWVVEVWAPGIWVVEWAAAVALAQSDQSILMVQVRNGIINLMHYVHLKRVK